MTLIDMARTMLHEYTLPQYFWAEAVHAASYVLNRVTFSSILEKTPYELYRGKQPTLTHLRSFGCTCYILKPGMILDKYESKMDVGIFVGYAPSSKAYMVYNKRTHTIQESLNVKFDENCATKPLSSSVDPLAGPLKGLDIEDVNSNGQIIKDGDISPTDEEFASTYTDGLPKEIHYSSDHPKELIIGDSTAGIRMRSSFNLMCNVAFISILEPMDIESALDDSYWIMAMQDEFFWLFRSLTSQCPRFRMMLNTVSFNDSIRLICVLLECRINRLFGDLHRLTRKHMYLARHLDASIQSKHASSKQRNNEWSIWSLIIRTDGAQHADGSISIRTSSQLTADGAILLSLRIDSCHAYSDGVHVLFGQMKTMRTDAILHSNGA